MPVLVEGISAIIRKTTIEKKYPGGWASYAADFSTCSTFCADHNLACIAFMDVQDLHLFIDRLISLGFKHIENGTCSEIAVIDQVELFKKPCEWLELLRFKLPEMENFVIMCRLKDDDSTRLYTPNGWCYDNSLSSASGVIPAKQFRAHFKYLRHEMGHDVYLNDLTGEETFIRRVSTKLDSKEK